jgi:hypothetical protein
LEVTVSFSTITAILLKVVLNIIIPSQSLKKISLSTFLQLKKMLFTFNNIAVIVEKLTVTSKKYSFSKTIKKNIFYRTYVSNQRKIYL